MHLISEQIRKAKLWSYLIPVISSGEVFEVHTLTNSGRIVLPFCFKTWNFDRVWMNEFRWEYRPIFLHKKKKILVNSIWDFWWNKNKIKYFNTAHFYTFLSLVPILDFQWVKAGISISVRQLHSFVIIGSAITPWRQDSRGCNSESRFGKPSVKRIDPEAFLLGILHIAILCDITSRRWWIQKEKEKKKERKGEEQTRDVEEIPTENWRNFRAINSAVRAASRSAQLPYSMVLLPHTSFYLRALALSVTPWYGIYSRTEKTPSR